VLDLTLRRIRQIQAAIFQRQYVETRQRRSEMSWQTRMLAQIIAAAMSEADKEGNNPLGDIAAGLDMDFPSTPDEVKQNRKEAPPPEPKAGSFERLMGMMGRNLEQ